MRMTKRRATQIVIRYAALYCEGSGVGLRMTASEAVKREIKCAIVKLWPEAGYDFPLTSSQFANMGLTHSNSLEPCEA